MNADARARLIRLWTVILTSVGAQVVVDPGIAFESTRGQDLPSVTIVPIDPPQPPPTPTPVASCDPAILNGTSVSFQPDSARFAEPAVAKRIIGSVAERLRSCPGRITVTGTTSSAGTAKGRAKLSLARAKAVRTVLARRLSVNPSTIQVRGAGCDFPGYVDDRRPDGSLDSLRAVRNRLVIITVQP